MNKQLKTVIAPREAEALQHEIATCTQQRSQLDDRELELLESVDLCEREQEQISLQLVHAEQQHAAAAEKLAVAQREENQSLERLVQQRSAQALVVPASLLGTYEAKRKHRPDGAIAKLSGPTCGACHLDIAQGKSVHFGRYPKPNAQSARIAVASSFSTLGTDAVVVCGYFDSGSVVRFSRPSFQF